MDDAVAFVVDMVPTLGSSVALAESLGYSGLFVLMFINATPIGTPPSEMMCMWYGVAISQGDLRAVPVVLAASIGNLLGTLSWYWLGSRFRAKAEVLDAMRSRRESGHNSLRSMFERVVIASEELYDQWGEHLVMVGRNIPFFRSAVSFPAGRNGMPLSRFLLLSYIGILIWCVGWTIVGYVAGQVGFWWRLAIICLCLILSWGVVSLMSSKDSRLQQR